MIKSLKMICKRMMTTNQPFKTSTKMFKLIRTTNMFKFSVSKPWTRNRVLIIFNTKPFFVLPKKMVCPKWASLPERVTLDVSTKQSGKIDVSQSKNC